MPFPPKPRSVITGASSGLGRALTMALSARGARLVVSDIEEPLLDELVAEAYDAGAEEVVATRCDVGQLADVEQLSELASRHFGGTDVVINNAGVAVAGAVGEVSIEDWRWQIDVNLWGVIHGCHVFTPELKGKGQGSILNVASAAGLISAPEMAPYNVTKSAVVALSQTMSAELQGTGVSVSVLCPTFFQSGIHTRARGRADLRRMTEKLITRSKWTSEQIAQVALRGLEKGQLHIVPQLDAKLYWGLHRMWPAAVQQVLGTLHRRGAVKALARQRPD